MYITVYLYIYPSRTWGCSGHDFLVILPLDVNPRELGYTISPARTTNLGEFYMGFMETTSKSCRLIPVIFSPC